MPELYDWQVGGEQHLITRKPELNYYPHAALGWDMGLGKTPILCSAAKKVGAETGLILAPKSVLYDWKSTLVEWGTAKENEICIIKKGHYDIPKRAKWLICNYEKIIIPYITDQILDREFHVLGLDEIHYLKSYGAKRVDVMFRGWKKRPPIISRAVWKWGLSGTPIVNDAMDLYGMIATMAPQLLGKYDTREKFGDRYSYKIFRNGEWDYFGSQNTAELRERIKPYLMCRRAEDVFSDMPEVITEEIVVNIPFEEIGADELDTPMPTLRKLVGEAKVPTVVQYAKDRINATGEKQLVFTYTQTVTEMICDQLRQYGAVKIYGKTSDKEREDAKHRFINDENCKVIVCQLNSVGTGTNGLQKVCYSMIFAEFDWTAGGFKQQIGRLKRLLQMSKTVYVTLILADDTLDFKITGSRKRKTRHLEILLDKGETMNVLDEILSELKALNANLSGGKPAGKQEPAKPQDQKPAPDAKAGGQKPAGKPASGAESKPKEDTKITMEVVRAAAKDLVEMFGVGEGYETEVQEGLEILQGIWDEFGVKNGKELKPAQLKKAHDKITAASEARRESQTEAEAGEDQSGDDY